MDILISVTAKIAEYIVQPLGRQLGYVFFFHANFQKLKTQVEMLKGKKQSVQDKVFTATRNAEDIKPAVEKWLKKVDDFVGKSEEILAKEGGHGRLCSTNLVQRHKLSRKARKMADQALEMKNEEEKFDTVFSLVGIPLVETSLPKVPDFLDFDSRKSTVEQIMGALSDNNVHRIGVCGMGGVGKTMLVKEIFRKIVQSKSFNEVVTSTISQTPDLKSIQQQLGDKLGLQFKQETLEGRAHTLGKRLKKERSILLVLDDIWEYIDLETIGIPGVEDHTGCKILFTSRDKHLISNEMCANIIFEIKVLRQDESWNLFKAIVGEEIEKASDLKAVAIQVVRECAGLPIAITTVAKALRNKSFSIWNDALDQLKRDDVVVNIRGMNKKVYSSLQLSYDYLDDKEAKLLFLLCSMYREDFHIDVEELLVYAMAMGFLHGVDTVVKGRRRITKLVDDLISSSLLQQSENRNNYVKMHDMVRDVAILIASKNDHIRTLSYVKRSNEEWEEEKLSGNHTVVSLITEDFHSPDFSKLMLPKVQLFMLSGVKYDRLVSVVETFSEEMKELKGLVLKHVNISLLPRPSLHSCANIRVLRLQYCEIGSIDMVGELKKLEVLDFSGSNIIQIPTTVCQLTQLKVLNLSFCDELEVIPPNILSKLTKLEELSVETLNRWEGEEWYEGRKNASLSELKCLPQLCALNLTIKDEEIIPKHLFSPRKLNLEKFYITIGCKRENFRYYFKTNYSRILVLKMESERCLDDWINFLLKMSEEVQLKGSICSKVLHSELLDANDFLNLKNLILDDSSEFQHLIHEKNKPLRNCLTNLEGLCLIKLENLESVIHGYDGESSFNNLKNVIIWKSNKLKTLFYNCILDDVLNLEKIEIVYCEKMEVMMSMMKNEEATNHIVEFTHLNHLSLRGLPRLQKFCSKIEKFGELSEDNSEKAERSINSNTIDIIGESFFSEEVSLPNLEKLEISDAVNLKMIWSNNVDIIPNSFSKLKEVDISGCNNLQKVLFPPNMMTILTCLNILSIRNCELLEGIFEVQEPISEVIQNLTHLELSNLPNLDYVWSKNPCELMSLVNIKSLSIDKCPRFKREYSIKILKQLETLSIDIKHMMEVIGKDKSTYHNMLESKQLETSSSSKVEVLQLEDGSKLFLKLKYLKIYGFVEYNSTHLPMEIVQILNQLEEFVLEGAFIKEIFPNNILIPGSMVSECLSLYKLPKLRHLWSEECSQNNNDSILQDLKSLDISECGRLSSLVSSFVCFTNLKELWVQKCDGLTHLLNPSVATTMLAQLEELRIVECKMMSSVLEEESAKEDGNDEIIVFNKLGILHIDSCSNLTSFYCGRCIIKFPRLKYVYIMKCPEMKVFSLGIVSTPHLKSKYVSLKYYDDDKWHHPKESKEMLVEVDMNVIMREYWEDNIDTRIPNLFGEQSLEENQAENSSSSS